MKISGNIYILKALVSPQSYSIYLERNGLLLSFITPYRSRDISLLESCPCGYLILFPLLKTGRLNKS